MTDHGQKAKMLGRTRHVHMVGIGGIGMSSIAAVLLDRGFKVSGSDLADNEAIAGLQSKGAKVYFGHAAEQVGNADVVVYSSAIVPHLNTETLSARERRIPVIPRSVMLGELMRMKFGIGVAGTHGKTTTTSMVGLVMEAGAFDPTIVVGGKVEIYDTNAVSGSGDVIVVEADEYDRTFLRLTPVLAVVTSLEAEHMDTYADLSDLKNAFVSFANSVPFFGAIVACIDDAGVRSILGEIQRRIVTYGISRQAAVRAESVQQEGLAVRFAVRSYDKRLGTIRLQAPGLHNVQNALAAVALGLEMDMHFEDIRAGLERYTGVHRRFQVLGEAGGIMVVDDYAHHPTEVDVTLRTACDAVPERRVVGVFQPHLYTRTVDLCSSFGSCFTHADIVVVLDIYSAREKPLPGVSGRMIAKEARACGHRNVHYVPHKSELIETLTDLCRRGDAVVFMGAGDIWRYSRVFLERLNRAAA